MRNIKTFEDFGGRRGIPAKKDFILLGEEIKKSLPGFTAPEKPFKRELTKEETKKLHKYFVNYSWSKVDAKGRIILGGGESERGRYYITPEDLSRLD
jgi:hypothetical protein